MEPEPSNNDEEHSHGNHILTYTDKLTYNGMFCDVTIKVRDIEIGAHKAVLATVSKYFEGMFRSNLSEASTGVVTFHDEKPSTVEACVEFIYHGKADVSEDNVTELLNAAELMVLPGLSRRCVSFLAEKVDVDSCAYIMSLSYRYAKEELDPPLRNLLLERFDEIAINEDFMALENNVLVYCLKLLHGGGSELEIQKWMAILSWVKHDYDVRKQDFPKLFESLDVGEFSKDFTRHTILEEPLVQSSASSLLKIAQHHTDESCDIPPCKRWSPMNHLVMCKPKEQSQIIVKYEVTGSKWSVVASFPGELNELAHIVSHEGRLFVGTGCKIYQYSNNAWKSGCPSQAVNKMFHSCVGACICNFSCPVNQASFCYNRCIAVGNSVYMLTSAFTYELNILTSRLYCHAVGVDLGHNFFITASNEKIYAFGGEDTERHAVEIDLKTKTRSRLCNMWSQRKQGHAFWYDDKAFAFGAADYPTIIECYLPKQDTWMAVSSVRIMRHPILIDLGPHFLRLITETSPFKMTTIRLVRLLRLVNYPHTTLKPSSLCCPSSS